MNTGPNSTSRRNFLKKSGLAAAATLVPLHNFAMDIEPNYKMGLQLFTIRDAMEKDPLGSLKAVAALGYADLETYGYDVVTDSYYGCKAKAFKQILDDLNLTATSGHYGFSDYFEKSKEELFRYVEQCISGAHTLDKKYIVWPWLHPQYRTLEHFKILAEKLNRIGEQVTAAGLGFAYHNHDFEFTDHDGQTGYDIILEQTDPELVKLQMDLYWVVHSSKSSPAELIASQPGRYVMWHIKDMDKKTRDYTELGNGSIDYTDMLSTIDTDALEYYYLEQGGNYANNSMQSIADSANYFKKHLQRYL
ncbi:TIM barrel protein [Aggregatimonas sangjinii]|uniref:TIM barrel protein n=1 Tax=Aggregatimonas sangjinii TaxID=2583587 RepID=A0A5B7SN18_9FLAO|nr:TIM barrel protein [Aggregatimonas sangjinii]QCW99955.1 TIM barrel protein [Aggregatimonas sangjinii]